MQTGQQNSKVSSEVVEILKDILITQLGLAGVPQQKIRRIAGCSMNRVKLDRKALKRRQAERVERFRRGEP
jgi:hypothetical protein